MWVDYRGSLSTVYNDGEISTRGWVVRNNIERVGLTRNTCSEYMKENVP